jgi:hypothetical protein
VTVVRIKQDGAVILYRATWRKPIRYGDPARVESEPGNAHTLGYISTDAAIIEPAADRLLAAAGWRRAGQWQIVGRDPVCRVRKVGRHHG